MKRQSMTSLEHEKPIKNQNLKSGKLKKYKLKYYLESENRSKNKATYNFENSEKRIQKLK